MVQRAENGPISSRKGTTNIKIAAEESVPSLDNGNWAILSSCPVGLLTGVGVVLLNNRVHEIHDLFWDGIPARGASWLREAPVEAIWTHVIVGMLNWLRSDLKGGDDVKGGLRPILKAVAACGSLGSGNSLGPEGPSVEIGVSIAKGVGRIFDRDEASQTKLSLVAAGSVAGISSGFNAVVAGCFFAVESVLWSSPSDASVSLTNTTSMVILSTVLASIVSEVGLGSKPAFKVPVYDFPSAGELPLYLILGVICGVVSFTVPKCTSYLLSRVDNVHEATGISRAAFPIFGGLVTGLIALAYPEILYRDFENVSILLESRPFVKGLSADLLLQLVAVKILATSLCQASGLVGGYDASSLFIDAATGISILCLVIMEMPTILLWEMKVFPPRRSKHHLRPTFAMLRARWYRGRAGLTSRRTTRKDLSFSGDEKRYASVSMNTSLAEALNLMIKENQSRAIISDNNDEAIGLLILDDIQDFGKSTTFRKIRPNEVLVSDLCCSNDGEKCRVPWTALPSGTFLSAQINMNKHGNSHVPVIDEHGGHLVGILDQDCIDLTCRALASRELLR